MGVLNWPVPSSAPANKATYAPKCRLTENPFQNPATIFSTQPPRTARSHR